MRIPPDNRSSDPVSADTAAEMSAGAVSWEPPPEEPLAGEVGIERGAAVSATRSSGGGGRGATLLPNMFDLLGMSAGESLVCAPGGAVSAAATGLAAADGRE